MSLRENVDEDIKVQPMEQSELIQHYFNNLHKEIGDGNNIQIQFANQDGEVMEDCNTGGTYYVDEDGQYYYQPAGDSQTITAVPQELSQSISVAGPISPDEHILSDVIPTNDEAAMNHDVNLAPNQMYQTVTIVPTETGNGEVSFVLIVQQGDEANPNGEGDEINEENDVTVYDFDENEDIEVMDMDEMDDKSKIIKIKSKVKPQVSSQTYSCSHCTYKSNKRYLLIRHMRSHSDERPHRCSVCDRGFKTVASLQNHIKTHTGTKPHKCKYCASAFTTSGELIRHVRYRHTYEKPHKCTECDYASVELSKLKRHLRCHTGERPYQCEHCPYASPDTFKLKRHLRTHTQEKPYECTVCSLRFTQSNSLKAHYLTHSGADKPTFHCSFCPATCGRKTDLRIHIEKLHTSIKPLTCKRCGKSFPDRYTYKVHNKSHEGEKCFKCELCPYASTSQRHLSSHMLIHTDEKPFACNNCDQSFRQKQLLKRHQNLYHNPNYVPPSPREKNHECEECGRQFRHKGNLIRHLAAHDPDSAFHEQSQALKLGRQKKLHVIDGQRVEIMTVNEEEELEEEEEEENPETITSDTTPNNEYVVLEVIQLKSENGSGNQQQLSQTIRMPSEEQAMKHHIMKVDSTQDLQNSFGFEESSLCMTCKTLCIICTKSTTNQNVL